MLYRRSDGFRKWPCWGLAGLRPRSLRNHIGACKYKCPLEDHVNLSAKMAIYRMTYPLESLGLVGWLLTQ